jgi:hypothetical protein
MRWVLLILAILAARYLWLWTRNRRQRRLKILDLVERRAVDLMFEFPDATDEDIATLLRDELDNHRVEEREAFEFATRATVSRMRRTIVLSAVRESRKELEGASSPGRKKRR